MRLKINILYLFSIGLFWVLLAVVCSAADASTVVALNNSAITVKAPDKVVLMAIANAGNRLVAVGEHGVIVWSGDNGVSWHQSKVPVNVTLTSVYFDSARQGWAVGYDGVVLHSSDGGANWALQLDGSTANKLALAAAQEAVVDHNPSPGTPLAIRRAKHFIADGPDMPFLSLISPKAGSVLVVGAYRMAVKSDDGGQSWRDWSLHIGDPLSHNLYDIAKVGTDFYIVGETGLVFRSTDGGGTFAQVTSPAKATLFDVLPTGDGGVFVCGVAGTAYRSEDGGNNWEPVSFSTGANLTGGRVLSSGAIVVVSESGELYISYNHARTFIPFAKPEPMELYDVAEAPDGDLVAIGNGGAVVIPKDNIPIMNGK